MEKNIMENRNIFWGVLLVTIGALFILDNMDILNFSFSALFDLWPLLLVGWGISILPTKPIYKTIASLAIAVFALSYAATSDKSFWWENNIWEKLENADIHVNRDDYQSDEETFYTFKFDEDMDTTITEVKLVMDVAAGKFRIDEPELDHLISFDAYSNIGPYNSNMVTNGSQAEIFISMDGATIKKGTNRNRATIKLNPDVNWDLNFDIGAADFRGDFREFKISNIDIDGGASSVRIKIGDLLKQITVKIDAAAASIKLDIPRSAACRVKSDSFLVDLDLENFTKGEDGYYISDNYNESEQIIEIEINAAISQLEINRY